MQQELLIVGIDPGITAAYAALTTRGKLVKLKSSKHLTLSSIIAELTSEGRVIAVGTDVKYSPKLVDKFCARLGAKLIAPTEDLKIGFKTRITENFRYNDDHQRDALASAVYAYHELEPVLKKIEFTLKKEGKENLGHDVNLLVIKGMSINDAIHHLEEKKEEPKPKKRIRSKIRRSTQIIDLNDKLRQENEFLLQELKKMKEKNESLTREIDRTIQQKVEKTLDFKGKKIDDIYHLTTKYKKENDLLQQEIQNLTSLLLSTNDKIVARRIKNLGREELEKVTLKEKMISVDDVSIFSEKSLAALKDKIHIIVCKQKPPQPLLHQPFLFIQAKELALEEKENFVIVEKESLQKAKEKVDILQKVVQEYQQERNVYR
jgi:predicted RNase H-like nuclease (RuvC/YqgF family)